MVLTAFAGTKKLGIPAEPSFGVKKMVRSLESRDRNCKVFPMTVVRSEKMEITRTTRLLRRDMS